MTLPSGWIEVAVGELGQWQGGGTPSKANTAFWMNGHIPWVSPKDMKFEKINGAEDRITEEALSSSSITLIPAGAILLVVRSGILKHTLPVAETEVSVSINQDLKALVPDAGVVGSYVRYAFKTHGAVILQDCSKAGTTVDSIDFDRLRARSFPLPPTAEQRRIVAKLDALTARIARARGELDRVLVLAKRVRKAAFATAFSGTSNASIDPSIDHRAMPLPPLPAGWKWQAVGSLGVVSGGLTKNAAKLDSTRTTKYLRVANVYSNQLRLEDVAMIDCNDKDFSKTRLLSGDVLIVEGNGSIREVGRAAIWSGELPECCHQNHLIRVRPGKKIDSKFLLYWLMSLQARTRIETLAASTSGLHTLSVSKIVSFPVPLAPLMEQAKTVEYLDSILAHADRLEAEAVRARALLDRLESSILAKAFRGELVPQDPNDEPASALLERIRAQRENAPRPKRGRRASTGEARA